MSRLSLSLLVENAGPGQLDWLTSNWQPVITCYLLVSIYNLYACATSEDSIHQFKYFCKNSLSSKCFGDLSISVHHPRFLLNVYSLWFSKYCQKTGEIPSNWGCSCRNWLPCPISVSIAYFFSSNENMFSSPLQYKAKCWLTAFCNCE